MTPLQLFAAASAAYFAVRLSWYLWVLRSKQKERQQPNFPDKLKQARALIEMAKTAQAQIPLGLEDLVQEALDRPEFYKDRRQEITDGEYRWIFGDQAFTYTAYRNMAEFALRHLPADEIPNRTRSDSRQEKWDLGQLMYYARWAVLREVVILAIVNRVEKYNRMRFATEKGLERSTKIAGKLHDYRSTAADVLKNLRRQQAAVYADRELATEEKIRQIDDLETLAEVELRALRRELGISEKISSEGAFQRKLIDRIKMLDTKQEAKAELEKKKRENPDMAEAIEELIADIDSGDWKDWRA